VAAPIPINGKCLQEPGAENGGARILSRSFSKTSVLADASGETIIYGEAAIGPDPDNFGNETPASPRLVFLDRASLKVTSEIETTARPYPRAVSDTQVVWHQLISEGPELRVATRAAGAIAENSQLTPARSLSGTLWEKGFIQGDQLFYEEDTGFAKTLRRIPLAGGTVTSFSGLLRYVVQVAPPIGIGSMDSFDKAVHLLQLNEGAPATPIGQPLIADQYAPASFTADASNAYALVSKTGAPQELYRMPLDGSTAPEKVGQYKVGSVIASDARFFVTYDQRFVSLVPVSGGEVIQLADLGQIDEFRSAVTTAKHLFLILDNGFASASSYLVEIALPQ
jgi:hypothetical protein